MRHFLPILVLDTLDQVDPRPDTYYHHDALDPPCTTLLHWSPRPYILQQVDNHGRQILKYSTAVHNRRQYGEEASFLCHSPESMLDGVRACTFNLQISSANGVLEIDKAGR